jgi:ketosteroid isomerase-like protein
MNAECPGKGRVNQRGDLSEMAAIDDLDEVLQQFQRAQGEFLKGNTEPMNKLFSHQEDVTLNNPLSPPAHGWEQVSGTMEHAASQFKDGKTTSYEILAKHVTSELAYVVEIERGEGKLGGREDITPYALRATMIFRPEDETWKIVHRHADPITKAQPAESVIQN